MWSCKWAFVFVIVTEQFCVHSYCYWTILCALLLLLNNSVCTLTVTEQYYVCTLTVTEQFCGIPQIALTNRITINMVLFSYLFLLTVNMAHLIG